uniref:K Homology domain-containing protein n=1 Tax=Timema tahoe TaxID=61484 RepID=A0A7R9IKN1_9NEOP|nr:unnamed protein product [Timema tahoe]
MLDMLFGIPPYILLLLMELSALPTGLRASRLVRKVDKPRPLKLPLNQNRLSNIEGKYGACESTCVEEIMAMTEAVSGNIANGNHDSMLQHSIMTLCSHLKKYGPQLETVFKGNRSIPAVNAGSAFVFKLWPGSRTALPILFTDQLDRAFLSFRNGSRDEHLDVASRLHLLEVIELRTRNWSSCEDTNNYYKQHIVEQELLPLTDMAALLSMSPTMLGPVASPTTPQPPLLSPGEIIKTSGKFGKPTKIPGKNYCKDEVVIRNSDSGKVHPTKIRTSISPSSVVKLNTTSALANYATEAVMGIKGRRVHMIEELSETIISFQRVLPGAKERLVQITGPSEGRINDAKLLIEDTIRRNASPVRVETAPEKEGMGGSSSSLNSSASDESNRFTQAGSRRSVLHHSFSTNDASIGEYKYTVTVGHDTLKITGTNLELVKEAKLLLDDYYSGERGGIYGSPDNFLTSCGQNVAGRRKRLGGHRVGDP